MNKIYLLLLMMLAAQIGCAKESTRTTADTSPVKEKLIRRTAVERVYFPFDSDSLIVEAADGIDQNIRWMAENRNAYIILEGHCDEVGLGEYNMFLGDRRARAVKAYMIEKGVSPEKIVMIISYGSTRPLNPGHRIVDLRENRRVEFVIR